MFKRVDKCFGVTLWRGHRLHLELWVCLAGIAPHRHPGQRVEVLPIWGRALFWRISPSGEAQHVAIRPRTWWRTFSVPAGWEHWFSLASRVLVFMNATFDGRSAANNFEPAKHAKHANETDPQSYARERARLADKFSHEWAAEKGGEVNTAYRAGMWYAYYDMAERLRK